MWNKKTVRKQKNEVDFWLIFFIQKTGYYVVVEYFNKFGYVDFCLIFLGGTTMYKQNYLYLYHSFYDFTVQLKKGLSIIVRINSIL